MENAIAFIAGVLAQAIAAMLTSLWHNWLPLALAVITAAVMTVHVNADKLKMALMRRPKVSILSGIAVGAFTPLCACGTMTVVLGLLTAALPWGPIMAFLTSSPLMSPDGFIMLAGIIGFKFAVALTVASVMIGLFSGYATHWIEKRTSFLKDQSRFAEKAPTPACGCAQSTPKTACDCATLAAETLCGCEAPGDSRFKEPKVPDMEGFLIRLRIRKVLGAVWQVGVKQILLFFAVFVVVGFLINYFIPKSFIMALFSSDTVLAVPLAALIGLPLYINGESAVPLIQALMDGGASGGAMLAFMITGPATSAWVVAGISAFMKRRIIGLYVAYILVGGIALGYLYDLLLALGV